MAYDYKEVVPYLLHWFDYNARILAWRENPKPYYVWVSEIMLQQTRVEAVKSYFDRFTGELPDIQSLAEASEEKLLKLWEGLGYYSRVRNLQKAAIILMEQYNGELPANYETLLTLPGIGEYTAGAIASIAFGIPVPAVDGNVLRVMKRIAGSYDDITQTIVKKELWKDIMAIMPEDHPGDFNQSLMELGAMVCLPNGKPLCDKCPVSHLCIAFHKDIAVQLPVKPGKKERRKEEKTILLLEYQDRYAIRKRMAKGLLAGLWELPGIDNRLNQEEFSKFLASMNIIPEEIRPMSNAKHIFSHVEWNMTGYHILLKEVPMQYSKDNSIVWADTSELNDIYSIPNAYKAFTKDIKQKKK
ncbi:MAG: A/G-specific adenine glycosylase [Herbinix sp.]|jgi:A/G-specific adenine glycosylase|nr:A/G-specific adenine glycosylase [Herbinix sp.]